MGKPRRPTEENFGEWLKMREERMYIGHYRRAFEAPKLTDHLGPAKQARAWVLRASACRRKRLLEEVREAWTIAFSLAPDDDPWMLTRYAVWQLDQGYFAEGLKTACDALDNSPPEDQPAARAVRAQALWLCGHRKESLSDFIAVAEEASLNSAIQISSIINISVVLANAPGITPKTAQLVLDLAENLRASIGNRELPRARALLRWATGLAHVAAGRQSAGSRDLLRARKTFLSLSDVASAAAITLDYASIRGRPYQELFLEILDEAPIDTRPEVLTRLDAMAAGRCDSSYRGEIYSLAMTTNVKQRWS